MHKNGDNSSNESSHFIEKICQVVFGLSRGTLRIAHIAYKDREPSSKQPNISVIPLTTNRDAILRKVKALPDELDGGASNVGDIGVLSAFKASDCYQTEMATKTHDCPDPIDMFLPQCSMYIMSLDGYLPGSFATTTVRITNTLQEIYLSYK